VPTGLGLSVAFQPSAHIPIGHDFVVVDRSPPLAQSVEALIEIIEGGSRGSVQVDHQ
jgi:hypothetical protein